MTGYRSECREKRGIKTQETLRFLGLPSQHPWSATENLPPNQKVFEPRFLYHCDRMGYLTWGEMANWGFDISSYTGYEAFIPEWMQAIERDFNHPSIIGWCPFNETWDYEGRRQIDGLLALTYHLTKQYDTTRPCIDTSGNFHVITDIYDVHDYEQDPAVFAASYEPFKNGTGPFRDAHSARQQYTEGLPMFVSEYGGIKWAMDASDEKAWGYGNGPKTEEEFVARYKGLTEAHSFQSEDVRLLLYPADRCGAGTERHLHL